MAGTIRSVLSDGQLQRPSRRRQRPSRRLAHAHARLPDADARAPGEGEGADGRGQRRRYVVGLGQQQELEGAAVEEDDEAEAAETAVPRQQRKHPWDHGKTELALSLNAALRPPAVVDLVSSDSELEEDDRVHCGPDHPRRRLILDSDSSDDDEATDSEGEDERWAYQFVDDEAQDDGASDETQEDEDLPTTADRAFINDDTEESNYDEDEGTWSEQEEEGRQGGDLSSALSRSLGSVDTDSEEDELDE